MSTKLDEVIRTARQRSASMTREELEDQVRNFAAGNAGIEDPRVTREVIDRAVALNVRPRR